MPNTGIGMPADGHPLRLARSRSVIVIESIPLKDLEKTNLELETPLDGIFNASGTPPSFATRKCGWESRERVNMSVFEVSTYGRGNTSWFPGAPRVGVEV